jgi:glyoxylase-like metal-dependent hydrolase (beta-lactamase superfamily II)
MSKKLSRLDVRRINFGFFVRPASETPTKTANVEPVYAYLVTHPEVTLLFDTGIGAVDPETEDHYQPRRIDLVPALTQVGARPEMVDLVANSHLHFDHCGHNADFSDRAILVQESELRTARGANYTMPNLIDFVGARYEILDGITSIAPGLTLIPTPGHSQGHQSLVVQGTDGTLIVAGQATDTASAFGAQHLARKASRLEGRQLAPSAAWLELLESFDPRRIVFAHDQAIWEPGS